MKTTVHSIYYSDARNIENIPDNSIALVVTSPPYPMITMWDNLFTNMNPEIERCLENQDGRATFQLMHQELDKVWREMYRVLMEGGIACINIGDAARTIDKNFQLFNNHSRIIHSCLDIGFVTLPLILWRKSTNAPNKFMGSGMLPAGAYVTLEHEYILILRKGRKREFKSEYEKKNRRESALFWEERNAWFSDIWDFKGVRQEIEYKPDLRNRSAAFPLELAHRLINMFSVKGDTVLDPFLGTGTTMIAAMLSARNCTGLELEKGFQELLEKRINSTAGFSDKWITNRLLNHEKFMKGYLASGKTGYTNVFHQVPVVTGQETDIILERISLVKKDAQTVYHVIYQ